MGLVTFILLQSSVTVHLDVTLTHSTHLNIITDWVQLYSQSIPLRQLPLLAQLSELNWIIIYQYLYGNCTVNIRTNTNCRESLCIASCSGHVWPFISVLNGKEGAETTLSPQPKTQETAEASATFFFPQSALWALKQPLIQSQPFLNQICSFFFWSLKIQIYSKLHSLPQTYEIYATNCCK